MTLTCEEAENEDKEEEENQVAAEANLVEENLQVHRQYLQVICKA